MSRKDSLKQEYWKKQLEKWKESGLSGAGWCRKNGVKECTFHYWKTRLTSAPLLNKEQFIELAEENNEDQGIEVQIGSVKIQLKEDFSEQIFKRVVRALEEIR